jgi:hypothetical protein
MGVSRSKKPSRTAASILVRTSSMTSRRIFTALANRVMSNANGLIAVTALGSATIFAVVQLWQLRFSLVDLVPLGCMYLMTRSTHWHRGKPLDISVRNIK